ncbi:ribonuclease kappa [Plakobranchus ocellatus]|uniref:Ribonuclease kappa n=1 Tax=Plakobranchus ocellatus TaxID=259542 RepID=A0AAV4CCM7_9GAST|nr:ribonuclease kappa [Plakobranchus ocellatus]
MACPVLGPKCSVYYMIISVWGVIMLILMGIFFKVRSPALFEDVAVDEGEWHSQGMDLKYVKSKYDDNALNCWIAAALYALLFVFSFIQQRMNARQTYETS